MKLSEKFKAIRIAEGLTQHQFCELIGLSGNTLQKYESGSYEPSGLNLVKLTNHPRFKKYTMWLMTDDADPSNGQVAPNISDSKTITVKSGGLTEEVTAQISSQQPDMKAIIISLSNLDDDEIQQLSRLLSRRGFMFLLELLDPDNQTLIGLEGDKKQAALQLESMNKEQVREILSKIEGNNRQFTENINDFIEKAS